MNPLKIQKAFFDRAAVFYVRSVFLLVKELYPLVKWLRDECLPVSLDHLIKLKGRHAVYQLQKVGDGDLLLVGQSLDVRHY